MKVFVLVDKKGKIYKEDSGSSYHSYFKTKVAAKSYVDDLFSCDEDGEISKYPPLVVEAELTLRGKEEK